jgi:hypothetical protein
MLDRNVHNTGSVQQQEQGRPPFPHHIIGIVNTVSSSSAISSPSLHDVVLTMRLDPMVMSQTTRPPLFVVGDSHTLSTSSARVLGGAARGLLQQLRWSHREHSARMCCGGEAVRQILDSAGNHVQQMLLAPVAPRAY